MKTLKLGEKEISVVPMKWSTQKVIFNTLAVGMGKVADAQNLFQQLVSNILKGEAKVSLDGLVGIVTSVPGLLDEILVLGLGITQAELDEASPKQVMDAIEALIEENELRDTWDRAKKVWLLLAPQKQQAK